MSMKNFKEIFSEMETNLLIENEAEVKTEVEEPIEEKIDAKIEKKEEPKQTKVIETAAVLDPRVIPTPPKARKSDKLIVETLKKVNGTSASLLEALTAQNTTQQQLVDALQDVATTNKMIIEKLDAIANIELPAPIIQVAPPRSVKRDVIRHDKGVNKGKIDYIVDDYGDEE